jgi:hypothetical protein
VPSPASVVSRGGGFAEQSRLAIDETANITGEMLDIGAAEIACASRTRDFQGHNIKMVQKHWKAT